MSENPSDRFRDLAGRPPEEATFFWSGGPIEVAERTWFQCQFSSCTGFETDAGLVLVDTGLQRLAPALAARLRERTRAPVHTAIYSHGHVDHAHGLESFLVPGQDAPRVIAQRAVPERFARYALTAGHNAAVNARQFGGTVSAATDPAYAAFRTPPMAPTVLYDDRLEIEVGGLRFELHHARGETDDHSWVWCPERQVLCTGDLFIWVMPNAGNPQKAQRYPCAGGLSYFGKLGIGPTFDLALQAAAGDSRINVIQKPHVQTSHAKEAHIFIGSTVPYVSSTYYGGGYGGGPGSSYQQMKVGIDLSVTPFINADGLVVMQIVESIDELAGTTAITGVGNVPNTTSRTLTAEVAVQDRETIILGGFIRNSENLTKAGVPILKDVPVLGALFTSRTSAKERKELIVLMRPTVLRTPELAALQVAEEKKRMPGVTRAESEIGADERKAIEAEQRRMFNQTTPFTPEEKKLYGNPPPVAPPTTAP